MTLISYATEEMKLEMFTRTMPVSRVPPACQAPQEPRSGAVLAPPPPLGYDAFIFDLDGTIWRGKDVIKGVPEVLDLLRSQGKKVFFVTK